jgi:predicted HicB family RNase H-like nuclease
MKREPAAAYIKRGVETVSMQTRISAELKHEAEMAADKLGTSLNRLNEAALIWYLKQLEKDGSL